MISHHSFPEARNKTHHTTADSRQLPRCTQEPGWVWCGTSPRYSSPGILSVIRSQKSQIRDTKQHERSWVTLGSCQDPFICFHTNRSVTQKNADKLATSTHRTLGSTTVTRCTCPLRATGSCPDFIIISTSKSWTSISEIRCWQL